MYSSVRNLTSSALSPPAPAMEAFTWASSRSASPARASAVTVTARPLLPDSAVMPVSSATTCTGISVLPSRSTPKSYRARFPSVLTPMWAWGPRRSDSPFQVTLMLLTVSVRAVWVAGSAASVWTAPPTPVSIIARLTSIAIRFMLIFLSSLNHPVVVFSQVYHTMKAAQRQRFSPE